jgi:lysophospholipase L1-like esterase
MPWPRHPLLVLLALLAIILTPRYIPQLHDWRLFEWSTVGHVLDFHPRKQSLAPLEDEQARLRPDLAPARSGVNRFVDPTGSLAPFYEALLKAERREPGAVVRVLHFGDSPTTADLITADVRAQLQAKFGDAGHGVYLIAKPWAWYDHRGFASSSSGWTIDPATLHGQKDGWYGLGGVSFTGDAGAWSKVTLKEPGQTRLTLQYVASPGGGKVAIETDGAPLDTLDTRAPRKTVGEASWRIPATTREVSIRVEGAPVRLFCFEFEKDSPGVIYNSIGLNGTWAGVLATYTDGPHWAERLRAAKPDLIVLSYGTNESGYGSYVDSTYGKDYREILRRLKAALPDTPVLVMSPMDRGARVSGGVIGTIQTLPRLIYMQSQMAAEKNLAFFNTFEAMGGEGTMGKWYQAEPRLVSADFIHPLPKGARIVGTLLYQAMYDGYNDWKLQYLRKTHLAANQQAANEPPRAELKPAGSKPKETTGR